MAGCNERASRPEMYYYSIKSLGRVTWEVDEEALIGLWDASVGSYFHEEENIYHSLHEASDFMPGLPPPCQNQKPT